MFFPAVSLFIVGLIFGPYLAVQGAQQGAVVTDYEPAFVDILNWVESKDQCTSIPAARRTGDPITLANAIDKGNEACVKMNRKLQDEVNDYRREGCDRGTNAGCCKVSEPNGQQRCCVEVKVGGLFGKRTKKISIFSCVEPALREYKRQLGEAKQRRGPHKLYDCPEKSGPNVYMAPYPGAPQTTPAPTASTRRSSSFSAPPSSRSSPPSSYPSSTSKAPPKPSKFSTPTTPKASPKSSKSSTSSTPKARPKNSKTSTSKIPATPSGQTKTYTVRPIVWHPGTRPPHSTWEIGESSVGKNN